MQIDLGNQSTQSDVTLEQPQAMEFHSANLCYDRLIRTKRGWHSSKQLIPTSNQQLSTHKPKPLSFKSLLDTRTAAIEIIIDVVFPTEQVSLRLQLPAYYGFSPEPNQTHLF